MQGFVYAANLLQKIAAPKGGRLGNIVVIVTPNEPVERDFPFRFNDPILLVYQVRVAIHASRFRMRLKVIENGSGCMGLEDVVGTEPSLNLSGRSGETLVERMALATVALADPPSQAGLM